MAINMRITVDSVTVNVSGWTPERLALFFQGLAIAQAAIEGAEDLAEVRQQMEQPNFEGA